MESKERNVSRMTEKRRKGFIGFVFMLLFTTARMRGCHERFVSCSRDVAHFSETRRQRKSEAREKMFLTMVLLYYYYFY